MTIVGLITLGFSCWALEDFFDLARSARALLGPPASHCAESPRRHRWVPANNLKWGSQHHWGLKAQGEERRDEEKRIRRDEDRKNKHRRGSRGAQNGAIQ